MLLLILHKQNKGKLMKKLIFVLLIVIFAGCKEEATTPSDKNAIKVDLEAVKQYPGFINFQTSYDSYTPDPAYIDSIKTLFKSSSQNLYIYLKPECSCDATLKTFPKLMKALNEAGIPEANIYMYVMNDMSYNYPEEGTITLTDLPEFFLDNGSALVNITIIPDSSTIEAIIYNSLK
jgi:hypothetical protein